MVRKWSTVPISLSLNSTLLKSHIQVLETATEEHGRMLVERQQTIKQLTSSVQV
jgi:hypothetical protein